MKSNFLKVVTRSVLTVSLFSLFSCSDDDYVDTGIQFNGKLFHIAASSDAGSLLLGFDQVDLANSSITLPFTSGAYLIPSGSSAQTELITSSDGIYIYALNGLNGNFYRYKALGTNNYTLERNINLTYALGTAHPNIIKVDDDFAVLTNLMQENGEDKLRLAVVKLEDLSIMYNEELILPTDGVNQLVDINSAVIQDGKIYLGVKKQNASIYSAIETLVVDYPSLSNPRFITSANSQNIVGFTSGDHLPTMYIDEMASIFQIVNVEENQGETHIVKINEDVYNPSFNFNLDLLLGEPTYAKGWFYVGNGVGYVPYLRKNLGDINSNNWAIARVDLYNHTATKLNLPDNINLNDCRKAVVKDKKLYIALTPANQGGNVYVLDATNPSPIGFTVGSVLEQLPNGNYIGIF